MTRGWTSAAVVAAVALASQAPAADVQVGVLAGPNLARIDVQDLDPAVSLGRRTALAAGAVIAWSPREELRVELQPMFVGKGAVLQVAAEEFELRARYLELPLVAKLGAGRGRVRPYGLAGLALGFRTGAKLVSSGQEEDVEDEIRKTDWTVSLGAGARTRAGPGFVFLDLALAWGLTDINVSSRPIAGRTRNRGVQIKVGCTLPVGHS